MAAGSSLVKFPAHNGVLLLLLVCVSAVSIQVSADQMDPAALADDDRGSLDELVDHRSTPRDEETFLGWVRETMMDLSEPARDLSEPIRDLPEPMRDLSESSPSEIDDASPLPELRASDPTASHLLSAGSTPHSPTLLSAPSSREGSSLTAFSTVPDQDSIKKNTSASPSSGVGESTLDRPKYIFSGEFDWAGLVVIGAVAASMGIVIGVLWLLHLLVPRCRDSPSNGVDSHLGPHSSLFDIRY